MARNTRFLGCQYPLEHTSRGIFAQKNGIDQIKADLLQLLLTNPGERVMNPEFGTPLRKLIFEPNDLTLELQARAVIAAAIQKWEPRIVIENIVVTSRFNTDDLHPNDTRDGLDNVLGIKVTFFDPQDINEVQQLVLEVPLASGA